MSANDPAAKTAEPAVSSRRHDFAKFVKLMLDLCASYDRRRIKHQAAAARITVDPMVWASKRARP